MAANAHWNHLPKDTQAIPKYPFSTLTESGNLNNRPETLHNGFTSLVLFLFD